MTVQYSRGCAFAFGPVSASQTWEQRVAAFCDRPALRGHDYCARHLAEEGPAERYTLGCDTLGCTFKGTSRALAMALHRLGKHEAAHPDHDAFVVTAAVDDWEGPSRG